MDFEVSPKATGKGYVCSLSIDKQHVVYKSREHLWIEHGFEPLLTWIVNQLTSNRWLTLFSSPEGSTWAEWAEQPDADAMVNIPIFNTD